MLHWLAGQRQQAEGPTDPDATGYIEPPETPAPVFAVRAFKHAIFGTPQTNQPKPRRNSATEGARPRNGDQKASRPGMTRPKSSSDAQTIARPQNHDLSEMPSSPTKGILLTPGTAAAKKKNVTFGDHVVDNEEKRPMKSGLPGDCPGDLPTPEPEMKVSDDSGEEDMARFRSRGKLNDAFERARDESRKRKAKSDKRGKDTDDNERDIPPEFAEPKSEAGKYWKREYDTYRNNTQREVKKLITKQKAAKSFAHTKDVQCTELADELRQEKKKSETLEVRLEELSTLIKDLHEELRASKDAEQEYVNEIAALKRQPGRKDTVRPTSSDAPPLESKRSAEQRVNRETAKPQEDPVQRASEPYKPQSHVPEKTRSDLQTLRNRMKSKSEISQLKPADDIWAQAFGSSSPVATRSADKRSRSPRDGRDVTSGTETTPLQLLDINSLSNEKESRRDPPPGSLDVEAKSQPDLERVDSKTSPTAAEPESKKKSPVRSPVRSPEQSAKEVEPGASIAANAAAKKTAAQRKPFEENSNDDFSLPVPSSSPFQPQAKQVPARTGAPPAGPRQPPASRTNQSTNTKENAPPASNTHTPQHELHMKPSAVWSSFNAPQASKRNTSVVGKDGKEVSSDRLEAARARINARGRVAS